MFLIDFRLWILSEFEDYDVFLFERVWEFREEAPEQIGRFASNVDSAQKWSGGWMWLIGGFYMYQ